MFFEAGRMTSPGPVSNVLIVGHLMGQSSLPMSVFERSRAALCGEGEITEKRPRSNHNPASQYHKEDLFCGDAMEARMFYSLLAANVFEGI